LRPGADFHNHFTKDAEDRNGPDAPHTAFLE
jgi:hypothetical protein